MVWIICMLVLIRPGLIDNFYWFLNIALFSDVLKAILRGVILSSTASCRHNDKDTGRLLRKIFTSHFIARVRKGLLKVCMWEGAGDRT